MTTQVKVVTTLILAMTLSSLAMSQEHDQFRRDSLKISVISSEATEYRVSVDVQNDQELAGMDIPLRFGIPEARVNLTRVEWSDRVLNFDYKHAKIDNSNKTVILGLIAEMGRSRADPYLAPITAQNPTVATLIFNVQDDDRPEFSTFTTEEPHHSLTFLYNAVVDSVLTVREFAPVFKVVEPEE